MKPFGLRVKEAIMIRPHQCVVDGQLAATYACDAANYVEVVRGTKGGRRRLIPIDSDVKREALDRARRFVARTTDSMADPRLSLKQAYRHFYYVLGRAGLTRGQLGVTAHGLRHQYANDKYEGVTGEPSPVRGGEGTSERNATARTEIAADLGHSRLQITNAYVGRGKRGKVD